MDFVDQLKSSIDIVNVVGERVRLRRVGSSQRHIGLCPFHTEKTPSFSVHSTHQFYKCFGCGASGDAIKFVMELDGLTFWEAIKLLAERNGIPLPKRGEKMDEESRRRGRLMEMHEIAARAFHENLESSSGRDARAYLERRSIAPDVALEFGLGLSDRSGHMLVRLFERAGFTREEMEHSKLVLPRHDGSGFYDAFRGRLMFPIHGETGRVIAFGGRALDPDDKAKYINSSESPIYRKSHVLYNLHRAKEGIRKKGRAVLVEGYMDVLGVWSAGVHEAVASCGTALTPWQVRSIKRHTDQLVLNFDPDAAGSNAAEKSIQILLEENMYLKVLQLDGGLDPDEYVKTHGPEAYRQGLENARGYFHWLGDRARARFDMRSAEGRVAGFEFLLPAIHKMPDRLERLAVANDLADYLGVAPDMVVDEFKKAATDRKTQPKRMAPAPADPNEVLLISALLTNPDAREQILPVLRAMPAVARFRTRRIFDALFRVAETQALFSFSDVEARLEEPDRDLLATVVFTDESAADFVPTEQALACLRKLAANDKAVARGELRGRIKAAERSGDMAEAMRLMEELARIERN
jgi:DNA primase